MLSITSARPWFIKTFPASDTLRRDHDKVLVYTDQHYDESVLSMFLDELAIPESDYSLGVGSDGHVVQTAEVMTRLDGVVADGAPGVVSVYGDANSTLAAALVAARRGPALAHVEVDLRSHNWTIPEGISCVLTDHCSDLLFAPSESAVEMLAARGTRNGVSVTGDIQYDAVLQVREAARERSSILDNLDLQDGEYVLATIHCAANTDGRDRFGGIAEGLASLELPVVFPVHPRTEETLEASGLWSRLADAESIVLVEPIGYLDFVRLFDGTERIAADSGSVQKEVFYFDTRCLTLCDETEWTETVDTGWNALVGADAAAIRATLADDDPLPEKPSLYGDGSAAERIITALSGYGDA